MVDTDVFEEDAQFFSEFTENIDSRELQLFSIINLEKKEDEWIKGSTENKDLNVEYNQ